MGESRGNGLTKLLPFLKKGKGAGGDQVSDEQQQQLLLLFEKRNQLKREFGKTLDELAALQERHDDLEKRHRHDSERLEGLERRLADVSECQNAILYYRLDALWRSCHQQLRKRRAELEKKFEELERRKLLEDFKAHAEQQQRQLEEKFKLVDAAYQEKAEHVAELQSKLSRSQRLWHYFRRKQLTQEILQAEEEMAPAVSQREECLAELERVRDREPPEWQGFTVRSKREINLQLIALAQYLVVHFSENDLAAMARSTQQKQPGDWHYGKNDECLALLRPIREIVQKLMQDERRGERLKRRADHLRQLATYSGNADCIPDTKILARIEASPGATESMHAIHADIPINVLESGFWNLDQELIQPE